MLSELLAPLSSSVTDAHRFRLYLHIKEIAKFANVATAPATCADPPHAYWTAAELASEVAQGALSRYCSVLAGSALDGEMLSCCKDRKEIEEFLVELCSDADDRRCLLDSLERAKSIQPTCQFLEGRLLFGQQRYSDAAKSWGQAVLLQHGPSHAFLSQMLSTGRPGVAKDDKRAFELAAAGAALGCAHSKGALGRCYFNGTGVAKDEGKGLALGRESAAAGSCFGQYVVGFSYETGRGVAREYAEAVRLYRLAAAQGHALAQNRLGMCFEHGRGVAQDHAEAVRLFWLAAAQGDAVAQNTLGKQFEEGQGVAQDRAEAIRWFRLSAAQGTQDASLWLKKLGA
jgi:TPR repeat protein